MEEVKHLLMLYSILKLQLNIYLQIDYIRAFTLGHFQFDLVTIFERSTYATKYSVHNAYESTMK